MDPYTKSWEEPYLRKALKCLGALSVFVLVPLLLKGADLAVQWYDSELWENIHSGSWWYGVFVVVFIIGFWLSVFFRR